MAIGVIDELLVGLGFEYDPEDLEEFHSDVADVTNSIAKFTKAVIGGTVALIGFTAASTSASDKQGKLAAQTGVSVEMIDALEFSLKRVGGNSESLASNLENLSIRISETSRGIGSGIEAFGILGISVRNANGELKETDDVLFEVADRLQKFSKAEQIELADKLGLRDSIKLLQEGASGIAELTKEAQLLGVTTAEDAFISAEFQDSLTDILQIGKEVTRQITRFLAPALTDIGDKFTDWWKSNKDLIDQKLPEFIDKITLAFKLLSLAALGFIGIKIIAMLNTMIVLFTTLGVRALLANLAIAALPILLAVAVAAFGLLLQDAEAFRKGEKSFIGEMIKKYPQWADEIKVVAGLFSLIVETTNIIFDGWSKIFDLFDGNFTGNVRSNFRQLDRDLLEFLNKSGDKLKSFDESIGEKLKGVKGFFSFSSDVETPEIEPIDISAVLPEIEPIDISAVLPDFEPIDISAVLPDIPEIDPIDISAILPDIPELDPIDISAVLPNTEQLEALQLINSIGGDTSNNDNRTIEGAQGDAVSNSTNQNVDNKINLGGINVEIKTNSIDDPARTGEKIGDSIKRQLQPLLKQATRDLNNAVAI